MSFAKRPTIQTTNTKSPEIIMSTYETSERLVVHYHHASSLNVSSVSGQFNAQYGCLRWFTYVVLETVITFDSVYLPVHQ